MKVVSKNQNDYEQFCMLKDSLLYNSDNKFNILPKCVSCGLNTHQTVFCSLLHFIPDKEKIIKKYEFSTFQERKPDFHRKNEDKKNRRLQTKEKKIKDACRMQKQLKKESTLFNFSNIRKFIDSDNIESAFFDSKISIPSPENSQTYLSDQSSSLIDEDDNENEKKDKLTKKERKISINSFLKKEDTIKQEENVVLGPIIENSKESIESIKKLEPIPKNEFIEEVDNLNKIESSDSFKSKNNIQKSQNSKNSIEPTKISNISKKEVINSNMKFKTNFDMEIGFEKHNIFENYFPFGNIDKILSMYHQKGKKNVFIKKYYNSKPEIAKKTKNSVLRSYEKYSFFPEQISKKNEFTNNLKEKENIKEKKENEKGESIFFKKKEFKKKENSFLNLIDTLRKTKKKK